MLTARKILYLILVLFTITSCKRNTNSDEKILSDIFPQLIDSLEVEWRPIPPPPPKPIYDSDSNFIGIDTIEGNLITTEYLEKIDRLDLIDSRICIGISDTCFLIDWDDLKSRPYIDDDIIKEFISISDQKTAKRKELNLCQIDVSDEIELILKSEIEIDSVSMWSTFENLKFAGLLEISKIYQLENKDIGLLQVDYYYDEWNGYSYFVIIEKTNKTWKVKKLLRNWVT